MITAVVLVAGPVVLGLLAARFGADSRDRRWSITGPARQAAVTVVRASGEPVASTGPHQP